MMGKPAAVEPHHDSDETSKEQDGKREMGIEKPIPGDFAKEQTFALDEDDKQKRQKHKPVAVQLMDFNRIFPLGRVGAGLGNSPRGDYCFIHQPDHAGQKRQQ